MDIIVEGVGKKFYTPDEVEISLDFYTQSDSYEGAIENGSKDVESFICAVLEKMNLDKEIMKTMNFRVYEETRYDYDKKIYIKLGYAYTQQANIKLDYSIKTIAEFMDRVSKLANPPKYYLRFNVKGMKKCKDEALTEAYNNAKYKAETIATAANKNLKECIKIDFRPFEESVTSRSSLNSNDMYLFEESANVGAERKAGGIQETMQTIFTPEDVEINEVLYCLFSAE